VAQPKRKKPGAKPRAGVAASVRLEVRLTESERNRWQAIADRQGIPLSELVRESVEIAVAAKKATPPVPHNNRYTVIDTDQ